MLVFVKNTVKNFGVGPDNSRFKKKCILGVFKTFIYERYINLNVKKHNFNHPQNALFPKHEFGGGVFFKNAIS